MKSIRSPPSYLEINQHGGKKMNDYKRNNFYSVFNGESRERKYYIKVNGKLIKVGKDVYRVIYNSYRKQYRDNKRDEANGLVSYDQSFADNYTLLDTLGKTIDNLDILSKEDKMSTIVNEINKLDERDKKIISELLFDEKKESVKLGK